MNILFIGDISGRPGRETVAKILPEVKQQYDIDFVIANCENAAGGRGVTRKVLNELQGYGIDFFTAGEHVWAFKDFVLEIEDKSLPIVRPYNYEMQRSLPGKGYEIIDLGKSKLVIACLIGQSFMRFPGRNPFWSVDELFEELEAEGIKFGNDEVIIDFHAEATAEKLSFAKYISDKATACLGTHTHVPTADQRLMGDMAYVTDTGMVGPLDASLWADFEDTINNFKYPIKRQNRMMETGRRVFNSVLIYTDDGKAKSIERIDKIVN